ncbi:hypothetical protein [Helicobacter heilmannii]|uniref:hypothetical protein n=1 Tax=Helicobacter heilmannii TaxID=35817 RepID=UPI000CF127C1|nr:hypothetical protein [Helicobacter heilmannii]
MRLAPLFLCLPLCAKPLSIASDIGNQEGFLDFLSLAFQEEAGVKVLWQPLSKIKHLCQAQAFLISKSALNARHLQNKHPIPLFKENFILLGDPELATLFQGKSPKAVLLELARPALAKKLRIVRTHLTPYKNTDLVLMSQRLYVQQSPALSVLYTPLNMHYFWLNPCHSARAHELFKWLGGHKGIFANFRINYQRIFTPIEDTYGN